MTWRRWSLAGRVAALLGVVLFAAPTSAQVGFNSQLWPQEGAPRPLPSRQVNFPPYEVRTLPNGMQVIIVLHHEQPAVTMRMLFRGGAAQDPERKNGLAFLLGQLLDQGTASRSAQQIADQIDSIGGALVTGASTDYTSANVIVMKDSFSAAMNLLADVVRNPAFAPEEIDRQKQQAISSQQVSAEDPEDIANALIGRLIYGFHPYGLPGNGTPESLASITRDDLRGFHQRYFTPNNAILAIVGDVTSEEAFSEAEKVFGRWPRAEVTLPPVTEPPPPTRRLVIVDKPDAVQTEVRVGQLAVPRKHPDYFAWDLAVKILGGEGANRLFQVLRAERGLTYSASADANAWKEAGDYIAETDTRTETTGDVLRLTVEEFARLQRQRVFERELAGAQAYLAGRFPLTIETPNQIATQVLYSVFYELPLEELATVRERILAVTPDDIQRVARQYIRPDRLSIVLVGNARAFIPQLQAAGFTEYEVIPAAELDLMSATLRRADRAPAPRPGGVSGARVPDDPLAVARAAYTETQVNPSAGASTGAPATGTVASDPRALAFLRRVIDAKGGRAALERVRTVTADAEMSLVNARAEIQRTRTFIEYPDRFRLETTAQQMPVTMVYDSGTAWVRDRGGMQAIRGAALDEMRASVARDVIALLRNADAGRIGVTLVSAAEDAPASTRTTVLEFRGADVEGVQLHVDSALHVVRQVYPARDETGQSGQGQEVFSDFRTVDGIQMAFAAEVWRGGRPVLRRTLTNVSLNASLAPSLFEPLR